MPGAAGVALERARMLAPHVPEVRFALGNVLMERGELPLAIRELTTARALDPTNPRVAFNLGHGYKAQGNQRAALEAFERLK